MVTNKSRSGCMDDLSIAVVVFEGAEEQDVVGPYEMFWWMSLFQDLPTDRPIGESDFADAFYPEDGSTPKVFTVAPTTDTYRMTSRMRFIPDFGYDNAPAANMIVAPGGRGARDFLRSKRMEPLTTSKRSQVRRAASMLCPFALELSYYSQVMAHAQVLRRLYA
jgi:putative intracellular protease/amidase